MARNRVDYCILCGETTCVCNRQRRIQPRKATAPAQAAQSIPMTQPAQPAAQQQQARVKLTSVPKVATEDQVEFDRAITVLADAEILHRNELDKYRANIDLPDHRIDAMIWRQDVRNGK